MTEAAVLPVGGEDGRAVFVQLRVVYPEDGRPRYLNPRSTLVANPRVGLYEPVRRIHPQEVVITEGIIDALSAAAAGYRAAAVLGAGLPDERVARHLSRIQGRLVIAFDADEAGRRGATRLAEYLTAEGRKPRLLALGNGDLNARMILSRDWHTELIERVQRAPPARAGGMTPSLGGRA